MDKILWNIALGIPSLPTKSGKMNLFFSTSTNVLKLDLMVLMIENDKKKQQKIDLLIQALTIISPKTLF